MSAENRSAGPSSHGEDAAAHTEQPYRCWTLTLMRTPPMVVVEARSFEEAATEARKQLEAWVPTAQFSGYATGTVDA